MLPSFDRFLSKKWPLREEFDHKPRREIYIYFKAFSKCAVSNWVDFPENIKICLQTCSFKGWLFHNTSWVQAVWCLTLQDNS